MRFIIYTVHYMLIDDEIRMRRDERKHIAPINAYRSAGLRACRELLGTPGSRWEDNINTGFKEIERKDVECIQNRKQ